jgi:hypothetical protein
MIKVAFLADHPEAIPTLVQWSLAWAPEIERYLVRA